MSSAPEDQMIEAEIERALEPYRGRVSASVLEEMRTMLRFALETHPVAQELVRRLRPPPQVEESGKVSKISADAKKKAGEGAR